MARGGKRDGAGKSAVAATTAREHPAEHLARFKFQPGQSGNSKGRKPGSRNKVNDDFLAAVTADFEAHGPDAIVKMREEKPADYVRMVASLLPKEVNFTTNAFEDMTDDELAKEET